MDKTNNLKEEYKEITNKRQIIINELEQLESDEKIQKYLKLFKENKELYDQQLSIYKDLQFEEYSNCHHLLVCSKIEYDRHEGRSYKNYGCIKCGLDQSIYDTDLIMLTTKEKIMYDYLHKKYLSFQGRHTDVICDLDLAQAIYNKIKEKHPNINDKIAIKYLKAALYNIRTKKVNEEREINRKKRLSLKPNFINWGY